jgi:glucose-1-phosphate adenylyltransferase
VVKGTVERSVLAPGVVVEDGAVVRSSVVLEGTIVRAGAVVEDAVLDEGVEVGPDARVGGRSPAGDLQVTVLGRRQRVAAGGEVPPGKELPDDDE